MRMRLDLFAIATVAILVPQIGWGAPPKEARSRARDVKRAGEPSGVTTAQLNWFDPQRSRNVPATAYYPAASGVYPVIVFSHGLGRSRDAYAYLGNDWASHGYVAVFVEHAGSDDEVWKGKIRPKKALREALEDPVNSINRPRDLTFILNQLQSLHDQGTPLGRRLDMDRIGAAGNDFGAQTAMALAGQTLPGGRSAIDPRIKCVVAMSPPVPQGQNTPASIYSRVCVPCLHMTGTNDDGRVGTTKAEDRRIPFDMIRGADQYLVTFIGGDHMIYSGHQRERTKGANDAKYQRLICLASDMFWDAYLKDSPEAKAWLASGGARSSLGELATIEKKLDRAANRWMRSALY